MVLRLKKITGKDVYVSLPVWEKIQYLKLKNHYKSADEVIQFLLKVNEKKVVK